MNSDQVLTVKSLAFNNDMGGTMLLDSCSMKVTIVRQWDDDEIGRRFVGELVHQSDIERLKALGATQFKNKGERYNPAQVYFGADDIIVVDGEAVKFNIAGEAI